MTLVIVPFICLRSLIIRQFALMHRIRQIVALNSKQVVSCCNIFAFAEDLHKCPFENKRLFEELFV